MIPHASSGTADLRVTLLSDERKPLDSIARDGGVRHTAVDGNNSRGGQ